MRVSFSIPLKPQSGKHKFAILLAHEMREMGVVVTNKKPDVNLVFLKDVKGGCKNIFRLDGVWMNTKVSAKKKNASIASRMKKCDGIIYQNEFCRRAGEKFIRKFKTYDVIMNGSKLPVGTTPYLGDRPYVLTFCRWRPHKRLKDTINGFLGSGLHKDYDLIVLGKKPDYVIKHPAVKYMGHKQKNLWSFILGSEYVVHLAYIDWCPNSVIESLVAGKNVLHSSTGGTAEVVRDNGIRITDKPWNFKTVDLYNPPKLNADDVSKAFHGMLKLSSPDSSYLNIKSVAKQYVNFCIKIIENG